MKNNSELKISLTKFGYHKLAFLLRDLDTSEIYRNLDRDGDKIDILQARKILSSYYRENDEIPSFWNEVKELGEQDIKDLIFFSIILSHHRLIDLVKDAFKNNEGKIYRENPFIQEKEYTNFVRTVFELGFIGEEELERGNVFVTLDITRIYFKFYMPKWILELIHIKAIDNGWDESEDILEYIKKHELHLLFNLSFEEFKTWISGELERSKINSKRKNKRIYKKGINFKEGHSSKYEGKTIINQVREEFVATLIHNRLQNKLYPLLKNKYPGEKIGTEVRTNNGSIDIVRKSKEGLVFYELKTSEDIKTSIRQAFGQIMEYAYWSSINNLNKLIIISPAQISDEAKSYIEKMRNDFKIPIYYQYFDENNELLSKLY